jgi:hypothetical protein
MRQWITGLVIASAFSLILGVAARADDSDAGSSVSRISALAGNVAMQRGDSGDTVAAVLNAPVTVGDYLSTSSANSRAEVQLDADDYLRVGANSQLRFTQLNPGGESVQLAAGTVELRIFRYSANPQIDTPSITISPSMAGRYRVSVQSDGSTMFTVRSGAADLLWGGNTRSVAEGTTVLITGSASDPVIHPVATIVYDGFDSWNATRDQYVEQAYHDQYVNAGVIGADDLSEYGHWVYVADYGNVWVPYADAVEPGWAPYHYGRWVWEPYYGWTWVGYEPWGWAPYHYGRWFWAAGYGWAWYPGPVYVRPVYRPALVAFFGFGGGGTSFSVAFGNVGWVPLAPFEPFHPWWGPRIVNRTVINVTNINVTNVNITRVYANARIAGGVAVVSHQNFTNGTAYHYILVHQTDLRSVALVKSTVPVVPTRQNLAFTKVNAGHSLAAAPLSPRFQKFAAPEKLPPSFQTQRTAIQTATSHLTPPSHLNASGKYNAGSSAWDRFNAGREGPAGANQGGALNASHLNAPVSAGKDPWSKFRPENNRYTSKTYGAASHASSHQHHASKNASGGGGKQPN